MSIILTILFEFLIIVLGILVLFNYRKRIGLAPLYILLGSLQYFQVNFEKLVGLDILGKFPIYPGSILLISAILFAILLIYIKEGVSSARALILGIIISNFFLIGLFEITNTQNIILGKLSGLNLNDAAFFDINYRSFVIGTIILLADFFLLVIIYQFLIIKIKRPYFFLILFASLLLVLNFDAFAFTGIMYYSTPVIWASLIGHIIGKSFAALIFSSFLYFYLKFFDNGKATTAFIVDQQRDIFSILQYRKKYFDLQIEKRKTEEKLTAQFEKTLTSISDGIVTLDENCCYTYVNKQAGELLGRTPDSLVGKNIWQEFPEGIGLPFHTAYYKAIETQKTEHLQDYFEPFDRWFENSIYPSTSGLTIYFTDITEQKRVEIALKDSEAFNKGILSSISAHIAVIDKTGTILTTNKAWDDFSKNNCEMYSKRARVGSNYFQICNDAIADGDIQSKTVLEGLKSVLNKDKISFEMEYHCDLSYGKNWFVLRAEPFGTASDKVVISHSNITKLKIAEAEREVSYSKLKEAQRRAKIGSWEFNSLTKECIFSDEMYVILEMNKGSRSNLYETFRSKCLPEDHGSFTTLFNNAVKDKNNYSFEYYIESKKNELKYIHELGELVKNEKGEIIQLKGTIQDISAEKLVNDELIHKNKELLKVNAELDRFVYSASHDLRAPLTSMRGLLQLMEMEPCPEEVEEKELHKLMARTIDKMDKFIDDILDYSINSRSELRKGKTDLEGLINSCWENLKYMDVDGKPICNVTITKNEAFFSDKRRLQIILNNLISNAIKYYDKTKTTHYINISLTIDMDKATIVIEDNGVGIDKANIDKIFDMFYRATTLSTGSGMGLYIVSETINKLQGTIKVVSDIGKGSRFTLTIPNANEHNLAKEA